MCMSRHTECAHAPLQPTIDFSTLHGSKGALYVGLTSCEGGSDDAAANQWIGKTGMEGRSERWKLRSSSPSRKISIKQHMWHVCACALRSQKPQQRACSLAPGVCGRTVMRGGRLDGSWMRLAATSERTSCRHRLVPTEPRVSVSRSQSQSQSQSQSHLVSFIGCVSAERQDLYRMRSVLTVLLEVQSLPRKAVWVLFNLPQAVQVPRHH
eukprot:2000667-Rhodomonas_salina.4